MKLTRQELISLLETHLIIINNEIWGKEQVINYLLREFERMQIDANKIKDKNEFFLCSPIDVTCCSRILFHSSI